MATTDEVGILRGKAKEMSLHLGSAIIDALFLGLWAAPNVGVERLVDRLQVTGIDLTILRCMQVLFGVSTLVPICIWIYKDIRIMWIRANQEIEASAGPIPQGTPPLTTAPTVGIVPKDGV